MAVDVDLEQLLAPFTTAAPSGRDVSREQGYDLIMAALTPEYDYPTGPDGREIRVPRPRDFARMRRDALALLRQGRDLRVMVVLVEALVGAEGADGLVAGLTLVRRSLEGHWDSLHPALDPEEEPPAARRLEALHGLVGRSMLAELQCAPLASAPGLGTVSWRAWELASGAATPHEYEKRPDQAALELVLRSMPPPLLAERIALLNEASAQAAAIDAFLIERVGGAGTGHELAPLLTLLSKLSSFLAQHDPSAAVASGTRPVSAEAASAPAPAVTGPVQSREDVVRVLDLVINYYRQNEPGSPIPLLLERARRLVPMNFLEVIADLAPDTGKQLRGTLGAKE